MKFSERIAHLSLGRGLKKPVEKLPWTGDMVLQSCGGGERVRYPDYKSASEKVRWVSRARSADGTPAQVREPREHTTLYLPSEGFTAAGKRYKKLSQLLVQTDPSGTWCRDKYGREVLYLIERFPCFDSYDAAFEDRYYRWFFLREGNRLTRIFFADEGWSIHVTEDVENLEVRCWEAMEELGYFD